MSNHISNSIEFEEFSLLRNIGCCLKCSLRCCGTCFSRQNIQHKTLFSKANYFEESLILVDIDPCIACLGILQNKKLMLFINKIVEQIRAGDYDCSTISFTCTIPNAVQIRERAITVYLKEKCHRQTILYPSKVARENIKDVWKWYLSAEILYILRKKLSPILSPFIVDIYMLYPEDQDECMILAENYKNVFGTTTKHTEKNITKRTIDLIMNSITDEEFKNCTVVPPRIAKDFINIDKLVCKYSSIFIGGRYTKLSRTICQTPWLTSEKYKINNSVQELICSYIIEHVKPDSVKFLSSGREDVDVRMLYFGRPFAIELINPRKINSIDLLKLYKVINNSSKYVKIRNGLSIISKDDLKKLKQGENSKSKTYRALCIYKKTDNITSFKKLENIENLEIVQYTPIRVLHRRTVSPRYRVIYEIRFRFPSRQELDSYWKKEKFIPNDYSFIVLDIKTQAGTYVKEFVHGDFGRTYPNLCYLLKTEIDIVALDVTNIALNWP